MKIGITGGAGFIGSNLVSQLIRSGHEVSVFDNFETGFRENLLSFSVNITQGDLKNIDAVNDFFSKSEIEYCVHLGALGSVPRSIENPRASFDSNVIVSPTTTELFGDIVIVFVNVDFIFKIIGLLSFVLFILSLTKQV